MSCLLLIVVISTMAVDWDHDQNTKYIQRIKLRNISLLFLPVHCDAFLSKCWCRCFKKKSSGQFCTLIILPQFCTDWSHLMSPSVSCNSSLKWCFPESRHISWHIRLKHFAISRQLYIGQRTLGTEGRIYLHSPFIWITKVGALALLGM